MSATLTSRAQSVWQSKSSDVSGYVLCVFCVGICTSMHGCTHVRSVCVYHLIFAELYFHSFKFSGSAAICKSLKLCCAAIADGLDLLRSFVYACMCLCVCVFLLHPACFFCILRVSFASCVFPLHHAAEADTALKADFLREIATMKKIAMGNCPYVVNMVGCCTLQEPLSLVLEYIPKSDLRSYLWTIRKQVTIHT